MTDLEARVPSLVLQHLSREERDYLTEVFQRFNGYPNLEQIWTLMDEQWVEMGCDPLNMDERVISFYRHPVWILNGLFIEQHAQSLENRQMFTNWVAEQKPARIVDFGGGFGELARLVGLALPDSQIEVVEPHPHPSAIAITDIRPNVRFVPELNGEYDMIIATDVFEHVPDPIRLAAETAAYLKVGGQYLMANCFQPVILCHLPQTFHFHHSWPFVLQSMGLEPAEQVVYGQAYVRQGLLDMKTARQVERHSQQLWNITQYLPRYMTQLLTKTSMYLLKKKGSFS